MDNLYDYIRQVDVQRLGAGEVSQCLLYLNYLSKRNLKLATEITHIREKLNKRVQELRQAKGDTGVRRTN